MIKFDIITIFPKVLDAYFNSSILARAQKSPPPLMDKSSISGRKAQSIKGGGKIKINVVNLRDFALDKRELALRQAQGNREPRLTIDDKPYGGGPGMVFKIEPMLRALSSILKIKNQKSIHSTSSGLILSKAEVSKIKIKEKIIIILLSAAGKQFDSKMAINFAKKYNHIVMIAGHYEGMDERIKKVVSDLGFRISDLSIGPYVLTGGEIPVMVLVDAVSRHIPGVLGKSESLEEKRFGVGVPAYTRPEVFKYSLDSARGKKSKKYSVPRVLLSGDHKKIERWREEHKKHTKKL